MINQKEKIQFPCQWEFRLVADAGTMEITRAAVTALGKSRNTGFELSMGDSSGSGKYAALRVSCQVVSLEQARELADALKKIEGVRFLI